MTLNVVSCFILKTTNTPIVMDLGRRLPAFTLVSVLKTSSEVKPTGYVGLSKPCLPFSVHNIFFSISSAPKSRMTCSARTGFRISIIYKETNERALPGWAWPRQNP